MATRSFFLAGPCGASPAARFMPPTHRRDTPEPARAGLVHGSAAPRSRPSPRSTASCIFCGLTRMALPPAMVSAAVANSNSFPLGRGTSSRKSFFISLASGGGVSRSGQASVHARRRCVVPRGLRASVSDLSKRRGFLSTKSRTRDPVMVEPVSARLNIVENGPLQEIQTFDWYRQRRRPPEARLKTLHAARRAAREPDGRGSAFGARAARSGTPPRPPRWPSWRVTRRSASSACSANSTNPRRPPRARTPWTGRLPRLRRGRIERERDDGLSPTRTKAGARRRAEKAPGGARRSPGAEGDGAHVKSWRSASPRCWRRTSARMRSRRRRSPRRSASSPRSARRCSRRSSSSRTSTPSSSASLRPFARLIANGKEQLRSVVCSQERLRELQSKDPSELSLQEFAVLRVHQETANLRAELDVCRVERDGARDPLGRLELDNQRLTRESKAPASTSRSRTRSPRRSAPRSSRDASDWRASWRTPW